MLVADSVTAEIVQRVLAVVRPQKIILFGSRARDAHRPGSDYDLLIVQPSKEPRYRRAVPLYRALASLPCEVDVVVYTPEEIADWSAVPQAFVTTALREGVVLYESQG